MENSLFEHVVGDGRPHLLLRVGDLGEYVELLQAFLRIVQFLQASTAEQGQDKASEGWTAFFLRTWSLYESRMDAATMVRHCCRQ